MSTMQTTALSTATTVMSQVEYKTNQLHQGILTEDAIKIQRDITAMCKTMADTFNASLKSLLDDVNSRVHDPDFSKFAQTAKVVAQGLSGAFQNALQSVRTLLDNVWGWVRGHASDIKGKISSVCGSIKSTMEAVIRNIFQ